jgi:hypothetical protein
VRDLRMFVLGLLLFSGELGLYDSWKKEVGSWSTI